MAFLASLLANFLLQKIAQSGASLVQLRFRISDRAAHYVRDFVVLVTLYVVEHKNRPIAGRQFPDGALKIDAIHGTAQPQVGSANVSSRPPGVFIRLGCFLERSNRQRLLAQAHQHNVDGHAMKPGRKRRFAPEGGHLAKKLKKSFLHQIFRIGGIADHPQAESVDATAMEFVEELKSSRITILRQPNSIRFRQGLWRLRSV